MPRWSRIVAFNVLATVGLRLALEGIARLIHLVDFPDPLITRKKPGWEGTHLYGPPLF